MLKEAFNTAKSATLKAQELALKGTSKINQLTHAGLDKTAHGADFVEKITRDHELPPVEIKNSAHSAVMAVVEETDALVGSPVRFGVGLTRQALMLAGVAIDTVTTPISKVLTPFKTITAPIIHPIDTITGTVRWAAKPLLKPILAAHNVVNDAAQSIHQVYERGIVRTSQHLNKIVGDTRLALATILKPIPWVDANLAAA